MVNKQLNIISKIINNQPRLMIIINKSDLEATTLKKPDQNDSKKQNSEEKQPTPFNKDDGIKQKIDTVPKSDRKLSPTIQHTKSIQDLVLNDKIDKTSTTLKANQPQNNQSFKNGNQTKLKTIESEERTLMHEDNQPTNQCKKLNDEYQMAGNEHEKKRQPSLRKSFKKLADLEEQVQTTQRKQRQIENDQVKQKHNYQQVISKYKALAGKLKDRSQSGSTNMKQRNKEDSHVFPPISNKFEDVLIDKPDEQRTTKTVNTETYQKRTSDQNTLSKLKGSSNMKIRLIAEKQHDYKISTEAASPIDIKNNGYLAQDVTHIRSLSLPLLQKPPKPPKSKQVKTNQKQKTKPISRGQQRYKSGSISDLRVEKERNLNIVDSMLANLKERAKLKTRDRESRTHSRGNPYSKIESQVDFFTEGNPKNQTHKVALLSLSNSNNLQQSPKTHKQQQKQVKLQAYKSSQQSQQEERPNQSQTQTKNQAPTFANKKEEQNSEKQMKYKINQNNKKILEKQVQENSKLQQIKQDIENENNEKEEILKSHRSLNQNLEISILEKRERISRLKAEITLSSSQEIVLENRELGQSPLIAQLQQQKLKKQKKQKEEQQKEEQQKLKLQIKETQKRIAEQQKKFKHLRESEVDMKEKQLQQKQDELEIKNKQISSELESRTKELEDIIKREQEKSKLYEIQFKEQVKKNEEITAQLKKQEELEKNLLEQVEKTTSERKKKKDEEQIQKNKSKMRLIEDIKKLEEIETKILMQYQRDSQAANSIFQAMRLKNMEPENQINQRKKQNNKKLVEETKKQIEKEADAVKF